MFLVPVGMSEPVTGKRLKIVASGYLVIKTRPPMWHFVGRNFDVESNSSQMPQSSHHSCWVYSIFHLHVRRNGNDPAKDFESLRKE